MMKKSYLYLIIGGALLLLVVLAWLLLRTPSTPQVVLMAPAQPVATEVPEREVTLYFASVDARYLVATSQRILCADESACLRAVVEALVAGPVDELQPVLPPRTVLHDVQVVDETFTLNFDSQLVTGHPGGSQSELLTVYALVNTVAVNFPHLRQMSLQVDGQALTTLRGHVDLQRPLLADFSFARRTADGTAVEGAPSR